MKKSLIILFVLSLVLTIPNQSKAQAFGGKGSKTFLLGLGFSSYTAVYPEDNKGVKGSFSPISFNFNLQGEFGIHDYIGLGFRVGTTYSNTLGTSTGLFVNSVYSNWSSFGIPIGMIGNFHFLQLIADKTGGTFADDLDVYAGLTFGAGPSFAIPKPGNNAGGDVGILIYGEARAGIRYYFSDKLGIFAEVGQGRGSRLSGGLAFKF